MESLALMVAIILFTSLLGGPTALLLTFLPDRPKKIRVMRTIMVLFLSLISIIFGYQLALGSNIPAIPRLFGIFGLATSILALLYEFKILKHRIIQRRGATATNSTGDSTGDKKLYAVIFTSKRQDANHDLYYQHDSLLEEKIKTMPGYVKHIGIRHPETRGGVTVAYFDSLEAIDNWRRDIEHQDAKKLAKSHFYENYNVEITEVIDQYGWN